MAKRVSRRQVLIGGLGVAGVAVAATVPVRPASASAPEADAALPARARSTTVPVSAADLPWPQARAIVAETVVPSFPPVTFDVTTFGAKNGGTTDNTAAFRRAIDVCNAAGGGTVLVPPGTYLTGAIRLRSNVNLRLAGATLMFSGDESRYPVVLTRYEGIECMNRSPMIYAYGERNIALTGDGTLDAAATASWNKGSDRAWLETQVSKPPQQRVVPGSGHAMRSAFVEPYNCRNVLIQGVTLRNSMFWQIHPTLCRNVTVDGVSTDPSTAHNNTDGCDPESCDHVVIRNCDLGAHDDNVAIKSGRDADGRRVDVPCQNIVVFGCQMNGNWGAITCGSEQTGGIRNVYAYRNTLVGATKFALYVKSNTQRGGYSQNINLDSFAGRVNRAYAYVTMTYNGQTGSYPPAFGPFTITNSSSSSAPRVFDVSGLPSDHVRGFVVSNCDFNGVTDPSNAFNHVDGVVFNDVKINGRTVEP